MQKSPSEHHDETRHLCRFTISAIQARRKLRPDPDTSHARKPSKYEFFEGR